MLRHFTIGRKIALLLCVLFLLGGVFFNAFLLLGEYQHQRDRYMQSIDNAVSRGSQTEIAIYFRDQVVLDEMLQQLLQQPHVIYAAVWDQQGQLLAESHTNGFTNQDHLDFGVVRNSVRPLDIGELERRDGLQRILDLSIPVYSFINPLEQNLQRNQVGGILAEARNRGGRHVVGYAHLGVNLNQLELALLEYGKELAAWSTLVGLIGLLLILTITRRITAPLSNLAQLAEDISAGNLDQNFKAKGTGEVHQIASMLNMVLSELNSYKAKIDVDRQLLSLKVDERTQQLSKRNKELSQAVKQVTQTKNRLRQLAYYDSLTALPNRQLFTEQLDLLLRTSRRDQTMLALLFIDLDNFKRINDSLGHNAGDVLLKEVAVRLSNCLRDSDLVAQHFDTSPKIDVSRLGGDEFTVVLNNIDSRKSAGMVAQRLIDSLHAPMMINGHEVVITPSIGIALAPDDGDSVEDLLKRADTAMYHAKSSGKNNFNYYTSSMKSSGTGRLKLESDLRRAVERNELVLHYQPQVNIETGEIIGAEALVRWEHPKHGLVPPGRFIPMAEEMGLIVDIGAWTMIEACRQSQQFAEQGLVLPKIAVNVSSLQFNPAFTELVKQVLADSGLPPQRLELELTEGVIMSNARASIEALHDLKKLGVSLSVDDFGTGYSSLSYLSRFPLDELKIDRSFVIDYDKSDNNASLVTAIIAMGKSLNLRMVAEGVDDIAQFHFLRQNGIQVIQGYLFSKPLPAHEFAGLLRQGGFAHQIHQLGNAA